MKTKIAILFISAVVLTLMLSNCAQPNVEQVVVTREVLVTRIVKQTVVVTVEGISTSDIAYNALPELSGAPSDRLEGTRWRLEHFIIDGVEIESYLPNDAWIQFEEKFWFGLDGCNPISGGYKINEAGDFLAKLGLTRLLLCIEPTPDGSGIELLGDAEYVEALDSAVEFEIQGDKLLLYYPADKSNVLVFSSEPPEENE